MGGILDGEVRDRNLDKYRDGEGDGDRGDMKTRRKKR